MNTGYDALGLLMARVESKINPTNNQSESAPSLTADLSTVDTSSIIETFTHRERKPQLRHSEISFNSESEHIAMGGPGSRRTSDAASDGERQSVATQSGLNADTDTGTLTEDDDNLSLSTPSDFAEELWLSDYSDDGFILEEDHPVWRKNGSIIVSAFLSAFQGHQDGSSKAANGGSSESGYIGSNSGQGSSDSSLRSQGKRSSNKRSYDDISGDGANGSSTYGQTSCRDSHQGTKSRQLFACPFCKKDSLRFRGCYSVKLTKISYVKQHLSRNHPAPIYCSICMERFENEHARDAHTRARNCQQQPLVSWEGVTESQKQQLRRRPPTNMSEEDQWYNIFKILFPGYPLPASPYIDGDLFEQLFTFQDFAASRGPDIVRDVLGQQSHGLQDAEMGPFLERIFSEAIPIVIQQFIASRRSPNRLILDGSSTNICDPSSLNSIMLSLDEVDVSDRPIGVEQKDDFLPENDALAVGGQILAPQSDNSGVPHEFNRMDRVQASEFHQGTSTMDTAVDYREYLDDDHGIAQGAPWFNINW
jgi:hypothetical protein